MADRVKNSSLPTWLVDPLQSTREYATERYRFTGSARFWIAPIVFGVVLLAISIVGWIIEPEQFYFSYHTAWTFCLTLALGALFFLEIQHLTKAWWGIVIRRIAEALVWSFPVLALLGLPLLFGMHDLFHWTHEELFIEGSPDYDPLIAGKRPYLNELFFYIRLVIYFSVWTLISYKLYTDSVANDAEPRRETPAKLRKTSAWGLLLTAVTTSFASYDLLMSLDPHWFSTIFGVYIFAGALFAVFAFITLMSLLLQRRGGMLRETVTVEHYHDLGKYMFGFTVFWAYIAFSQYMLIWYAGIPEETLWYRHRLEHGWGWHSAFLLLFHFIVPFIVLLPRFTKRFLPVMGVMSVWFLIMHWFDLYWIVMPVLHTEQATFHWLDLTCWLGLSGIFFGLFFYRFSRHPIAPQRDPHLRNSLRFENV